VCVRAPCDHISLTAPLDLSLSPPSLSLSASFQVNTPGAAQLCELLREQCDVGPSTVLLDVCCGTGTLGLSLASAVKRVIGIEICVPAVADARANAERNGVTNATFIAAKAEDATRRLLDTLTAEEKTNLVAIVDPPRAGLHSEVLKALRACLPLRRMLFVSCHAPAFVSNAIPLCRPSSTSFAGPPFTPTRAFALDLFPHTPHCELIVVLERPYEASSVTPPPAVPDVDAGGAASGGAVHETAPEPSAVAQGPPPPPPSPPQDQDLDHHTEESQLESRGQPLQPLQPPCATANAAPCPPLHPLVDLTKPREHLELKTDYPGIEMIHGTPPVFLIDKFLSEAECDAFIEEARPLLRRSRTAVGRDSEPSTGRTSDSCHLSKARGPSPRLLQKISLLTGKPAEHMELPQVTRYRDGQRYVEHFDAVDPQTEEGRRFCANGGQRIATVLVYLNSVSGGGRTVFSRLGLQIEPERGSALVFFPGFTNGELDTDALHCAMPAIETKWVTQVWIRQTQREDGQPTALDESPAQAPGDARD
jgi:SAM-dependent methyltransferase